MERPGTHFHVIRLHDHAAPLSPKLLQLENKILKTKGGAFVGGHSGITAGLKARSITASAEKGARHVDMHYYGAAELYLALTWCAPSTQTDLKALINKQLTAALSWHISCNKVSYQAAIGGPLLMQYTWRKDP